MTAEKEVMSLPQSNETFLLPENRIFLENQATAEASESKPSWGLSLPPLLDEDGAPLRSEGQRSVPSSASLSQEELLFQCRVATALSFYRDWGHRLADLDPLSLHVRSLPSGLVQPDFTLQELDKKVLVPGVWAGQPLGTVLTHLHQMYCGTLALESAHMEDNASKTWLYQVFEQGDADIPLLTAEQKEALLTHLIASEGFEKFLATKFPSAKRFGLEGTDNLIPALCLGLVQAQTLLGVQHTVIGMAHRGRLNVMAHVMDVPFEWFFAHFQGAHPISAETSGSGDVKYHLGAQTTTRTLLSNPSHLESVNPLVLGWVKGLQEQASAVVPGATLGLLIHGDAAFMGQGVVAECLMLSRLKGYETAGTIHIILNNQVGFTANPGETRSSFYASDLVKGFGMPVLHVNGDDTEAVFRAFWIACLFRQKFGNDIVIDLTSYRRHGHNEMDEPTFTQPLMYAAIHDHPSPLTLYARKLAEQGIVTPEKTSSLIVAYNERLTQAFERAASDPATALQLLTTSSQTGTSTKEGATGVPLQTLETVGAALTHVPEGFHLHPKLQRFLEARVKMTQGEVPFDWSMAEAFACGTLLHEGTSIRMSGQDVARGTFTQRHSVWIDQQTGLPYISLNSLSEQGQAAFINSPLSEMGVMGFDLGYSLAALKTLVMWEGQFGDFANGAQIIIDQYLASGETKWSQMTNLVLLLPHGYEGQGPEHSSARLERFLQLAAEDNMRVANCSTPANYFHILRRQAKSPVRKPLVLMTPKSLLRHKLATSPREALGPGTEFQAVLADTTLSSQKTQRIVLCSGKLYYDLLVKRTELNLQIPLIRLEEFYPFPEKELEEVLRLWVSPQTTLVWAQEEPYNQGAWFFLEQRVRGLAKTLKLKEVIYAGRAAAASPATGYNVVHLQEQEALLLDALGMTKT